MARDLFHEGGTASAHRANVPSTTPDWRLILFWGHITPPGRKKVSNQVLNHRKAAESSSHHHHHSLKNSFWGLPHRWKSEWGPLPWSHYTDVMATNMTGIVAHHVSVRQWRSIQKRDFTGLTQAQLSSTPTLMQSDAISGLFWGSFDFCISNASLTMCEKEGWATLTL